MTFDVESFLDEPEEFNIDSFLDEPIESVEKSNLATFGKRVASHGKAVTGGLMQQGAATEDITLGALTALAVDNEDDNFLQDITKKGLATLNLIGSIGGYVPRSLMPWAYKDVDEKTKKIGESLAKEGIEGLKNEAYTFEDNSLGYHAANIGESLALMIPALGAGYLSGGSAVTGLAAMAPVVYGEQFAQSKDEGRDNSQAAMDANFHTVTELITEVGPFNVAFKAGQPALTRLLKTVGLEGLGEVINSVFQRAYDAGVVNDKTTTPEFLDLMTNDEALREYRDSLIAGAGMGLTMGAVGELAQGRVPPPSEPPGGPGLDGRTITPDEIQGAVTSAETVEDSIAAMNAIVDIPIEATQEGIIRPAEEGEIAPGYPSEPVAEPLEVDQELKDLLQASYNEERAQQVETERFLDQVEPKEAAQDVALPVTEVPRETITEPTADIERAQEIADKQRIAEKKKQERIAQQVKIKPEDTLLAAVAKLGGIQMDEASEQGIDQRDFVGARHGIRRSFTRGGDSFDGMAERLREYGFDISGPNDLLNALQSEIKGMPVRTPVGDFAYMEEVAKQREYDARQRGDIYEESEYVTPKSEPDSRVIENLFLEASEYPDFAAEIDAIEAESEGRTNTEQDDILKRRTIAFLEAKRETARQAEDIRKREEATEAKPEAKAETIEEITGEEIPALLREQAGPPTEVMPETEETPALLREQADGGLTAPKLKLVETKPPDILTTTKRQYVNKAVKEEGLKKKSPGYKDAVLRIGEQYDEEVLKAEASLPFEQYNKRNADVPESVNRQAYNSLRKEFGLPVVKTKETGKQFSKSERRQAEIKTKRIEVPVKVNDETRRMRVGNKDSAVYAHVDDILGRIKELNKLIACLRS